MHFLIIKSSAIGDIIHALPVVQYLRQKFPTSKIDWVAEEAGSELLSAYPELRRVLTIDTKSWRKALHQRSTWKEIGEFRRQLVEVRYDVIFDLQGNSKSGAITALSRGKEKVGFGWKSVAEKPNLIATQKKINVPQNISAQDTYLKLVQSYFGDTEPFSSQPLHFRLTHEEEKRLQAITALPKPRYMVAFGSNWRNKTLPEATLINFLKKLDAFLVFIWGNEHEKKVADELKHQFSQRSISLGNLSLPLWQAAMREMDLVIAMDSAALHLCATTNTPSFSFFGPTVPAVFKPSGDHHHHIQGQCPYGRSFARRCPILRTCPTGACIRDLKVEEILTAFNQALQLK
jgi:heptosyltransferase-1